MHDEPVAPRTVKPRSPVTAAVTPIIIVTETILYVERTDTYRDPSDLYPLLRAEPPSLVVCEGMARLLLRLHNHFQEDPRWQFCVAPLERQHWGANRLPTLIEAHDTLVSYFGWKGELTTGPRGGARKGRNHYHVSLDPISFAGKGARQLTGVTTGADADVLLTWALQVREFCVENGLRIKPTAGGLSGQLLRDPRFYPAARRKVPAVTNAKARDRLPGNHYRLYKAEGDTLQAYYLDQSAAHHRCALTMTFPCANRLFAWGNYRENLPTRMSPKVEAKLLTYHGLFRLLVDVPHSVPGRFPPPWAERGGEQEVWIYSNELPVLRELRVHILQVLEVHASPHVDTGLNAYAQWALDQIKPEPSAPWIKPVLLSTYGILAARPRFHRVGFAHSEGGRPTSYPAGAGHLPVIERASRFESEPGYTNVIHRGMIEAETRLRSLQLARDLHRRGYDIIACYADSIFVATHDAESRNVPLPLLPNGWRVQSELTNLVFINPVSFVSAQMSKTPGVPSRAMLIEESSRNRQAGPLA